MNQEAKAGKAVSEELSSRPAPLWPEMFSLAGRTALVTGARTGIGRAIAVGLAHAGADLLLHGRTDELDATASDVTAAGRDVDTVVLDLSRTDQITATMAELLDRRRVDILVNNAGVIRRAPATDVAYSDWRAVLDVDLDAVFLLSQLCGRAMIERGGGKIVTIASLLSFQGGINVTPYTASKHAVAGVTKALANEWGPYGVQVNAIAPGYVETSNTEALRTDSRREPEIRRRIPAGRWGSPDDLVGAAVFLASPAADYVNGHVLVVDGGWMAR